MIISENQQGFVLPMTLIVLALLTVLSMGISQMAKNNISAAQLRKDSFEQELAAKREVQWVLYHLLVGKRTNRVVQLGQQKLPVDGSEVDRNDMLIHVQDNAGLLGLAFYQQEVFERLLVALTDKKSAELLAARLGDWVDQDHQSRFQGMEAEGYLKAGLLARPRNAAIRSLDELLDLSGMTTTLYNGTDSQLGLQDLLVAGGEGHFNIAVAPEILIGPVLNISGSKLKRVLALRRNQEWDTLYASVVHNTAFANEDYSPFSAGSQYQIRIDMKNGVSLHAMYAIEPYAKVPYRLMLWHYPDYVRGG